MKLLNSLVVVFCLAFCMSCSSDDDSGCSQQDWVGTYTLDASTAMCSDPNVELSNSVIINSGTSSNSIDFDGLEIDIDGCTANEPTFQTTITLEGTVIRVEGFGCTGTYNKN